MQQTFFQEGIQARGINVGEFIVLRTSWPVVVKQRILKSITPPCHEDRWNAFLGNQSYFKDRTRHWRIR